MITKINYLLKRCYCHIQILEMEISNETRKRIALAVHEISIEYSKKFKI